MSTILDTIIADSRPALAEEMRRTPIGRLAALCEELPPTRDFAAALRRRDRINVLAELKKASPSKGIIRLNLNCFELAGELAGCGAAALSVLTEPNHFHGGRENLYAARAAVDIPLLRKDFIFDEYQLFQARLWGADAVLLIAAVLPDAEIRRLADRAAQLGLAVLAEAHDQREVERLLGLGMRIIGVNARDLRDFTTSLDRACEIVSAMPDGVIRLIESAISSPCDFAKAEHSGADAALIGETLMRAASPGAKLEELYG